MAHDIRASARARLRRWRARKRAERELAAHAAEVAATEARRARGRTNTANWRARREVRQVALDATIKDAWFAPPIDPADLTRRIASEHNGDRSFARDRVEGFQRGCTAAMLNLNSYVLKNCVTRAMEERTVFHELVEAGLSIPDAVQQAKTTRFTPSGGTAIEQQLDRETRFNAARFRWYEGAEILDALRRLK